MVAPLDLEIADQPTVAGDVAFFAKLARQDALNVQSIVAAARKKTNPLAGADWSWKNPEKALKAYDIHVASSALGGLQVWYAAEIDGEHVEEPVAAFAQRGKSSHRGHGENYGAIEDLMADPIDRAELLTRLLKEMRRIDRQCALLLARFPDIAARWRDLRRAFESELEGPSPEA